MQMEAGDSAFDGDFNNKLIAQYNPKHRYNQDINWIPRINKYDEMNNGIWLGIDIPDMRYIIHWVESQNVCQYW